MNPADMQPEVAIVGVGYVGLTLAAALADAGIRVWGYDRQAAVVAKLQQGEPQLYEPGLADILRRCAGKNLFFSTELPTAFGGVAIICVSTPVTADGAPDLANLREATVRLAACLSEEALVIVRSTVPIGTSRRVVLPILQARHPGARLAFCPERTIQGRALEELRALPQVIGALDAASRERAQTFWQRVTPRLVPVGSLEAAELVKLVNNCHTDLLYAFGNEVALWASAHGVDPLEVVRAANADYPRPAIARPGFVGGPCLSKDPYLLQHSFDGNGYRPRLVAAARAVNEELPARIARHVVGLVSRAVGDTTGAKLFMCGFAYKGWPVTDDIRGTPALPMLKVLRDAGFAIYGHDYLVPSAQLAAWGVTPVSDLASGFDRARAVLFVNEHPDYRRLELSAAVQRMERPAVVYDCWRMFDPMMCDAASNVHYAAIGYG